MAQQLCSLLRSSLWFQWVINVLVDCVHLMLHGLVRQIVLSLGGLHQEQLVRRDFEPSRYFLRLLVLWSFSNVFRSSTFWRSLLFFVLIRSYWALWIWALSSASSWRWYFSFCCLISSSFLRSPSSLSALDFSAAYASSLIWTSDFDFPAWPAR